MEVTMRTFWPFHGDCGELRPHYGLLLLTVVFFFFGPGAKTLKAQADYSYAVGAPPFTQEMPVENGFINLANGNLHLEIPLASLAQRGGGNATVSLVYDSAIWSKPVDSQSYPIGGFAGSFGYNVGAGWGIVTSADAGNATGVYNDQGDCILEDQYGNDYDTGPEELMFNPFVWFAPDGSSHAFSGIQTWESFVTACGSGGVDTPNGEAFADDGSGYYMKVTNYQDIIVYAPDGTVVFDNASFTLGANDLPRTNDTNGNYYSETQDNYDYDSEAYWAYGSWQPDYHYTKFDMFDTLGRTAVEANWSGGTITINVPNVSDTAISTSGTSTYTITLENISVCSDFNVYIWGTKSNFCGQIRVVQSIQLPDGSSYSFGYDYGTSAGHYGQLTSMTLPAGGTIAYSYGNYADAVPKIDWGGMDLSSYASRWITGRVTPDSSTGWTYSGPSVISTCGGGYVNCQQAITVTKPTGDYSTYTFSLDAGSTGAGSALIPWLTEVQSYDSSSTLRSTTTGCYSFVSVTSGSCSYPQTTSEYSGAVFPVMKLAQTTTLPVPGGNVSTTKEYTWNRSTLYYGVYLSTSLYQLGEWNFGNAPTNAADKTTTDSYYTFAVNTSTAFASRVSDTIVTGGGGTVSETANCYDYSGGCGGTSFASGTAAHHNASYDTSFTTRGDLTQVKQLVSGTNYLTTSMTYDIFGNVTGSTDSNANMTSNSYSDCFVTDNGTTQSGYSPSATAAYPTSITAPLSAANISRCYYLGTGQLASATDANSRSTHYHYYDSVSGVSTPTLNRLTLTQLPQSPNNGWTRNYYDVGGPQAGLNTYTGITDTSETSSCSDYCRHDETDTDSLGRVSSNRLVNDPDGETYIDTTYDSDGRVHTVTNPYRTTSESTYGVTTFAYDALDRKSQTTQADSSIAHTYFGDTVTSHGGRSSMLCSGYGYPILTTDEAGKVRQSWIDAFGRLIEVDEPDPSSNSLTGGSYANTCYTYNLNDNLTVVSQGAQTRTFNYDLMSRLTSAANPESGTTYYCYAGGTTACTGSSSGSLCSGDPTSVCRRTDANGTTTTYCYDALNRMTGKRYAAVTCPLSSSDVGYSYDSTSCLGLSVSCYNVGRRTGMSDGSGSTSWAYDEVGNVLQVSQTISSTPSNITNAITYTYNLDSSVTSITYPSGRTITYTPGNAQRPIEVKDTANSINYATLAQYAPQGALKSLLNGGSILSSLFYNQRLQPCRIAANSSGMAPGGCSDTNTGNIIDLKYDFSAGSSDNGNVVGIASKIDTTRSQSFTYDSLNRIATAAASTYATSPSHCWGESYSIDRYGNLGAIGSISGTDYTGCTQENPSFTIDTSKNRFVATSPCTDICYDSDGNMTYDGTHLYTYDAENHMIQVDSGATATYTYDGDGRRVKKSAAILYWYGTSSDPVTETDSSGNVLNEYIFFNGKRIARREVH